MATATQTIAVDESVNHFVAKPRRMLIDGKWVDAASGKTFPTYNPSSGEVLAYVAEGGKEDIDRAVAAARAAFDSGPWRKLVPSERARLMWKLADLLEKRLEEFAQLESLDNGKPVVMARLADVPVSVDTLRYYAGWATKIEGSTIPLSMQPGGKFLAYTLREPIGVVGQIVPWNFPLVMATLKLGPALAVGCTVVLKPAEQTPLTALLLGELIQEAGFPDGVVNIVPGDGATAGAALAAHPQVDKIAFTGSTEVGKRIVHAATGNLKKLSLELGGKSPNIVFQDAEIDSAIPGAANAIFFNQGEVCVAGSRLYVEDAQFDNVVDGVSKIASGLRIGPGMDTTTQIGPLISQEQLNRVCGYLESGYSEGAKAAAGGKRHGERGYFVQPTVLVNTSDNMKVVREEIFGPVVTVMPFSDVEDLIAKANNTPYGLAAGVWTRDIKKAHRVAAELRAGTVWVNCYGILDPALPFGGYKQSGWGREMGRQMLDLYTETKSVCTPVI
ncbi:MAG TPA: aldehyde dehydrogenase family protein [Bryobacteraceae bacterium]|nr:aldehyde dehydrogenase family protein [Bryobacteraceae bacterium]